MRCGIQGLVSVLGVMALVALSSCTPPVVRGTSMPALTSAARPTGLTPAREAGREVRLLSRPQLRVAVFGPQKATYQSNTGGLGLVPVDVVLTNSGQTPADITGARIGFTARRDGVAYPCRDAGLLPSPDRRELLPGASVAYERSLDCVIPVLGSYDVDVFVRFGAGPFDKRNDAAGRLALDVSGSGTALPRPHPSLSALHLALVGETSVFPVPKEKRKEGEGYQVHAVFVNTGVTPMTLGPMHLSLRVASGKHHLACATEPFEVPQSTTIEPGRTSKMDMPVACNLDVKGDYDVAAFVVLDDDASAEVVEMGRLDVHIAGP